MAKKHALVSSNGVRRVSKNGARVSPAARDSNERAAIAKRALDAGVAITEWDRLSTASLPPERVGRTPAVALTA